MLVLFGLYLLDHFCVNLVSLNYVKQVCEGEMLTISLSRSWDSISQLLQWLSVAMNVLSSASL
jgi:hypothetical protein